MSAAQDKHVSPSILEQQVVELRAEVEQLHMALDWATGFLIAHPQDNPAHEAERITALANIGKHERQARAALQSAQKRGIA